MTIENENDVEEQFYDQLLKCILTEDEKKEAAACLVEAMNEKTCKEDELASIKNQFKGEISRLEAEINAKANLVRDGYEFRPVSVRETKDFTLGTLVAIRMDTYEAVKSRKLSETEMQRKLPGMEGNNQ